MTAARLLIPTRRVNGLKVPVAALIVLGVGLPAGLAIDRYPLPLLGIGLLWLACAWGLSFGWVGVASLLAGSLPWLIVLGSTLPHLMKTFVAAGAAAAVLALVAERGSLQRIPHTWIAGVLLLSIPIVASLLDGTTGLGRIQAVKYLVFPTLVLAIATGDQAAASLARVRRYLFWSAAGALLLHAVIITLGYGQVGSYYGLGERLGFVESPHELAFLAVAVAAAAFSVVENSFERAAVVSVAAPVALLTGVRAGALALVIVALFVLFKSRRQASYAVAVVVAALVLVVSGAPDVLTSRVTESEANGEFTSIGAAGSSRGNIWSHALEGWEGGGPYKWVLGTGLREIKQISAQTLGEGYIGHSDIVEVLVELGILGLVGLVLLWVTLLRSRIEPMVLSVLLTFAVLNGSIEWLAPMAVTLLLSYRYVAARKPAWPQQH
jgi:hypothetical protein